MKTLNTLCNVAGWAIFLTVGVGFTMNHGNRWEFGPHGLPRVLIAQDGKHYLDGSDVDPATLALHKSGQEDSFQLVALGIIVALLAYSVRERFRMERLEKQRRAALNNSRARLESQRPGCD